MIERHAFLLLKSWPRMLSMAYYPTVTMIMWAFVTVYLRPTSNLLADAPGTVHRRGAAVGHSVPRSARRVADVFRGDVFAQPRQPIRQSLTRVGDDRRATGDEHYPNLDRRRRRVLLRLASFQVFDFLAGLSADCIFCKPHHLWLGDRTRRLGHGAALGPRRGRARVGGDLSAGAGIRRLLPDRRAAGLAADDRPCGADQLRFRGHALRIARPPISRRPFLVGAGDQRAVHVRRREPVFAGDRLRAPAWHADADGRIARPAGKSIRSGSRLPRSVSVQKYRHRNFSFLGGENIEGAARCRRVHHIQTDARLGQRAREAQRRKTLSRTGAEQYDLRLQLSDRGKVRVGERLESGGAPAGKNPFRSYHDIFAIDDDTEAHVIVAVAGEDIARAGVEVELHVRFMRSSGEKRGPGHLLCIA